MNTQRKGLIEWGTRNALTIILALLAAQNAYYNFNATTREDIATLRANQEAQQRQIDDLKRQIEVRR